MNVGVAVAQCKKCTTQFVMFFFNRIYCIHSAWFLTANIPSASLKNRKKKEQTFGFDL